MPPLSQHQSTKATKLLLIGDSGGGKTGALASLASAGYNLRIADLDNGLDILRNLLTASNSVYKKDAVDRVNYITLTEHMKDVNGKLVPKAATVWPRLVKLLQNWKEEELGPDGKTLVTVPGSNFGPITSWGEQDVLVIDSLTMASTAALNYTLYMNGRLGQQVQQSDWYHAQNLVESLLQMLFDDGVRCNVIINCHITYLETEGGMTRGYPNTLGKALPPKVGAYFNTILGIKSTGTGASMSRKLVTTTMGVIDLKNTAPLNVPKELPIETGLADYFKIVRGN